MTSAKSSLLQPLLETPPVQLYPCQYSYPSAPALVQKVGDYLEEHSANHIPFDHELPYLRGALQETLAELDRSDSELGRLRDVVRRMEERRRRLVEIAFRLDGMVKTTIRRLPLELLTRIFFMARDEGNEGWSTCRVPLTLSHVCSRWRALVHSQPALWCIIDAKFRVDDVESFACRILEFTKFCLERSQPKPINVTLTTPEDVYGPEDELQLAYKRHLHKEVLVVLLASCSRWKVADLLLWSQDAMHFTSHKMDFPILEELKMCFQDEAREFRSQEAIISAPRLSQMHLGGMEYGCLRPMNLDGLTQLTMEDYHIDDLLYILQHSPNLSDLKLTGFIDRNRQSFYLPVTSRMKSLRVELLSNGGDIFEQLCLPLLTMLEVMDSPREWNEHLDVPQLCQFISRSRPAITHLRLSTITLSPEEVMSTLALLPTITHLRLEAGFGTWDTETMKRFLCRMTVERDSTDSILLPNLMLLCLHIETQFEGRMPFVLAMVESRCGGAVLGLQKLAVLYLIFRKESEASGDSAWKRIGVLREHGLDVQVNSI
ncbi:hypothetical protein Moror_9891 [Moniliophthora roreri MCA 2997]|uniref:Uncharacterized protein n=1 Tax=Moniliophthora roreri (strain MCA 2997) TaxID=1381753 RepID=V2WFW1_MONRO|nr:hypothetical protein Moror_9891 [Moniliophthora roreri MCA 2997]